MHNLAHFPARCIVGLWVVLAFFVTGCGPGGAPKPSTVKVTGKVLYKDQPVAGASVAFLGDGQIPAAWGRTDAEGKFELTTTESGDGAVPGMHKVTVSKSAAPKTTSTATGVASMEEAVKKSQEPKGKEEAAPTSLLPEKYAQAATSTLSFEVKSPGPNDFTIKLED